MAIDEERKAEKRTFKDRIEINRSGVSAKTFGELYVRPVFTPGGDSLGWAVCVLIEESPPATPIGQGNATGQRADLLTICQCRRKWEALCAEQGLHDFLLNDHQLVVHRKGN